MSEPIVFISTHRIKEGKLDEFKNSSPKNGTIPRPQRVEPEVTFVWVFSDADGMDLHFQGVDETAAKAHEFVQPTFRDLRHAQRPSAVDVRQEAGPGVGLVVKP